MFTTAPALHESKREHNPERTYFVRNVGDAEHFNRTLDPELPVASELAELPRPVIGFVGAISDYKLDTGWLLHLAKVRPTYSVVLVGPIGVADPSTGLSRLRAASNVHMLGPRDYATLPS